MTFLSIALTERTAARCWHGDLGCHYLHRPPESPVLAQPEGGDLRLEVQTAQKDLDHSANFFLPTSLFPLGTLVSDKRILVRDQLFLVERARSKLSGWKADTLSQAGKL